MAKRPAADPPRPARSAPSERTVEQLTARNVEAIAALEQEVRAGRTPPEQWVDRITALCGSISFAVVHAVLFAGWILANSWPAADPIDPYPFTFLTLLVSLEAIFLSTFILISQKAQTRLDERRNALDLQINLLSEQENTKMLIVLQQIARKVGADVDGDPALAVLEQATRPEKVAEQIDRITGRTASS